MKIPTKTAAGIGVTFGRQSLAQLHHAQPEVAAAKHGTRVALRELA